MRDEEERDGGREEGGRGGGREGGGRELTKSFPIVNMSLCMIVSFLCVYHVKKHNCVKQAFTQLCFLT